MKYLLLLFFVTSCTKSEYTKELVKPPVRYGGELVKPKTNKPKIVD